MGPHLIAAPPHVLGLHLGAVLLVDGAPGVGLPARVGVLLPVQHQRPPGHLLLGHIHGGGRYPVENALCGHGVAAGQGGAVNLHRDVPPAAAVVGPGLNLDGVVGIVFELKIDATVIDCSVHAVRNIAHGKLVAPALHNLQLGVEHGVVESGGGLAHPAARLLLGLSAHIDRPQAVAVGHRAGTGGVVVGEHLPGENDLPVAGVGRQGNVVQSAGRAGDLAGGLSQQVPEQVAPQVLLCDLGPGHGDRDGKGLAPLGLPVGLLQLLHVEVYPYHVVGNLHGLQIQGGILGLGTQLLVYGPEIGLLPLLALGGGQGEGVLCPPAVRQGIFKGGLKLGPDLIPGRLPVDGDDGRTLGHLQAVTLDLIGVVLLPGGHRLPHPVHQAGHGGVVLRNRQGHLGGGPQHVAEELKSAGEKVLMADLPGVFDALPHIYRHVSAVDGLGEALVRQGEGDIFTLLRHGRRYLVPGLLHKHVRHVDPRHAHVGQNRVLPGHPGAGCQIGRRQHTRRRAGNNPAALPAALALRYTLSIHRSRPPVRDWPRNHFTHTQQAAFAASFYTDLIL